MSELMTVEVAYATPEEQQIIALEVPLECTIAKAIELSRIDEVFPEIDLDTAKVGIFGKLAKPDAGLVAGDRIEIYRKLIADPKEARKKRAADGKTMKKGAAAANAEKK